MSERLDSQLNKNCEELADILISTESQNHRGWRGSLEVTWFSPPAQAGPRTAGAQDHVQTVSEYL